MHIKVSNLITNSEILFPSRMTFFSNMETFHFVFTFSVNIGTTIVKLASTVEIKISTFVRVSKETAFIFTVATGTALIHVSLSATIAVTAKTSLVMFAYIASHCVVSELSQY